MSPKRIDLLVQVYRMFSWIFENKNLSHIFRLTSFLFRSRGQVSSHELNIKDNVLLLLFGEDTDQNGISKWSLELFENSNANNRYLFIYFY